MSVSGDELPESFTGQYQTEGQVSENLIFAGVESSVFVLPSFLTLSVFIEDDKESTTTKIRKSNSEFFRVTGILTWEVSFSSSFGK